jgi:hypothetical protein
MNTKTLEALRGSIAKWEQELISALQTAHCVNDFSLQVHRIVRNAQLNLKLGVILVKLVHM